MRPAGATRVGVEWVDQQARADYKRKRRHWNAALFKSSPDQRWCNQCGWPIKPGEAYRQRGPKRRVPGRDTKSDYTCSECPWSGPLDVQAVLDKLTPAALHLARLWATYIGQRHVSLADAWQTTSAHGEFDFHGWWSDIECMAAEGVLRIPSGVNDCGVPPVYVETLVGI